jgi:hypothetical protein
MNQKYLQFYTDMQNDIERIKELDLPELNIIELCFKCTGNYWDTLAKWLRVNGFDNKAEEIDFFKNAKPRFTGQIEYYTQVYRSLLFLPNTDKDEQMHFWDMEARIMKRFFELNGKFLSYYVSHRTDMDEQYYVRREIDEMSFAQAKIYTTDANVSSPYDQVLANFVGYGLYGEYMKEQRALLEVES